MKIKALFKKIDKFIKKFAYIFVFLAFLTGIIIPNGIQELREIGVNIHFGHLHLLQLTTFKFAPNQWKNFDESFSRYIPQNRVLLIYNAYDGILYPNLKWEIRPDPEGEIEVDCEIQVTKEKCIDSFQSSKDNPRFLTLTIKVNNPKEKEYKIYFKIGEGWNYREKRKSINIIN